MGKSILVDLNLNKNELQNAVLHPLASAPQNPKTGQLYYNTTNNVIYKYDVNTWNEVGHVVLYSNDSDKVVVCIGDPSHPTEKSAVVDIILGQNYGTEVQGGVVEQTQSLGEALKALDTEITQIAAASGEPNVIENVSVGGNNVTITNKVAVIPTANAQQEGTLSASDWSTFNSKEPALTTQTAYSAKGTSTKVPQITTNTKGQVTGITEVDIAFPSGSGSVTGSATSFVKEVSLSGHTLSGQMQTADSTIDSNSTSIPTSQAVLAFVNSSVENVAAYYITKNAAGDAFDTKAELTGASTYYSGGSVRVPTRNDYAIVLHDETKATDIGTFATANEYIGYYVLSNSTYTEVTASNVSSIVTAGTTHAYELPTCRYINSSSTNTPQWDFQYVVNNSGLTAAQIAAINSGITSSKVSTYDTHVSNSTIHVTSTDKTNWNAKLDPVTAVTDDTSKDYVTAVTQTTAGQVSVTKGKLSDVFVSAGMTFTVQINNPAITITNGVATWTISRTSFTSPFTGTVYDFSKAIANVKEVSSGDEVMVGVTYSASSIVIKMNASSNLPQNTYTCTICSPIVNS